MPGATRPDPAGGRRRLSHLAAAAVALLGAALLRLREPILLAVGDYLVVQDRLQASDVIHVLGSADRRTDYGIRLYEQGYADRIFFTGSWPRARGEGDVAPDYARALEQGVPAGAITVDGARVASTYAEGIRLKALIEASASPIRSVIVVTDPHHTRRARWAFRRVLGDGVSILMAPVPFGQSPFKRRWWTDEGSRQLVWDEYRKIAYYYVRYQYSWGAIRRWLASLDED